MALYKKELEKYNPSLVDQFFLVQNQTKRKYKNEIIYS